MQMLRVSLNWCTHFFKAVSKSVSQGELIILPGVRGAKSPDGTFTLTQKYLEGVSEYARFWQGPVTSLIEISTSQSTDFDHIEVDPGTLDTGLEERPADMAKLMARLERASVVLGFLSRRDAPLAPICRAAGLPLVYVTEYSYETEVQIIHAEEHAFLKHWRRRLWLGRTEKIRRRAVAMAAGLQCSGTPTYEAYRRLQPNTMVFFDNRIRHDEVISEAACQAKAAALADGRPLRLIYGGRFTPMKGVMALPEVAAALRQAGVAFSLDIYGDGPLKDPLAARIEALGLGGSVRICPPVDFRSQWVPMLMERADLFVCCHPQGDPSSTYPEVMACGVPIAGYDNAAFRGIVAHSGCGWSTPLGQPQALADQIAVLDQNRSELAAAVPTSREFAIKHTFETTFRSRIDHLKGVARHQLQA